MSSIYLNPPPSSSSPIPNFLELKGDQYNNNLLNHQVLTHDHHLACQILDKNPSYCSDESSLTIEFSSHAQDLKVEDASNYLGQVLPSSSSWAQNDGRECGFNYGYNPNSSTHGELEEKIGIGIINNNDDHKNPKKWKPSKVRIMQKMMATSKHTQDQHNLEQGRRKLYSSSSSNSNNNKNNNNSVIRICSDCRTTTTPLWRSGPQGPKSLCNACGIRQRKARRAAMAAAAAAVAVGFVADNEIVAPIVPMKSPKPKIHEEMRERGVVYHHASHPLPLKKRGKTIDVDKCGFSSSNNKDYVTPSYYYSKKRALPRDEEEGAILLMALSCGLACSL